MIQRPIPKEFYNRDTTRVAKELLGKKIFHNINGELVSGVITETEAYLGVTDPACHTYKGRRTPRTETMFKLGGHSYVYFIYGMYFCFNIVTRDEEHPEAVLIRGLMPVDGIDIMKRRRKIKSNKIEDLCSGPGKLSQAMGFNKNTNGLWLQDSVVWVEDYLPYTKVKNKIVSAPRVGIDYAGEAKHWKLRFILNDDVPVYP